jgi:acyl-coenzyme A thioesterase PaaI-like protein
MSAQLPAGDGQRVAGARARFALVPFARWLGVTIAEVEPDRAVLLLPHRPEHLNAGGVLSGGASASLLTMAGTLAAWTGVDLEAHPRLSSVDLSALQHGPRHGRGFGAADRHGPGDVSAAGAPAGSESRGLGRGVDRAPGRAPGYFRMTPRVLVGSR